LYLSDLGLTIKKEHLEKKNISHYCCGTLGFVAPEVLQYGENGGTYDESSDMFSVGCIFYFLHTGNPLFKGRNKKELYLKNRNCSDIDDKLDRIAQINPEGLDLMRQLLSIDPSRRISAESACNHPYFRDLTRPDRN
jgi:serine/threonine protein kinase